MKQTFKFIAVIALSLAMAFFSVIGILSVVNPRPSAPVSNMTQSDSIEMLKLEIEVKQTIIDEQTKALKACDELTEQLMKGLE